MYFVMYILEQINGDNDDDETNFCTNAINKI